jgi:nicotinamidase-related amidase
MASEQNAATALLVMDVQVGILARYPQDHHYLARLGRAIRAARRVGIPVIYVVIGFRSGHPEVSVRNAAFAAMAATDRFGPDDPGAQIHPEVAPVAGDIVVTKKRVGAFTGSDLEVVLRSLGVTDLVLTGIATSGVVLSTVRAAADRDYRLTVLADCCLDADPEVHRVLLEKLFPRQADVLTIAEWTASLTGG